MVLENKMTSLHKFINFITFIDLPIKKKFLLFAIGVLFWFVAMFVVILTVMFDLENKSQAIVDRVVPHERTAQMVIRDVQDIIINATELANVTTTGDLVKKAEASATHLNEIAIKVASLKGTGTDSLGLLNEGRVARFFFGEAIASEADIEKYLAEIMALSATAAKQLDRLTATKISALSAEGAGAKVEARLQELRQTLDRTIAVSNNFSGQIASLYAINTEHINSTIHYGIAAGGGVLLISTLLLIVFTFWISRSIAHPVAAMIDQIRGLSSGDVDLSKRIMIASKDEIGSLSAAFNNLMESIHSMSTFKKVIEQDDSLEDVYGRLGKVLAGQHGMSNYTMFEISNSQNRMKPVYPPLAGEIDCNSEIMENCELCKAKKNGRIISSLEFPGICKQFKNAALEHVCLPMMVGGSTGGVVQFVFTPEEVRNGRTDIEQRLVRARHYISESVAVIEAKRLLGTLRDSALTDPLTGLHNRRYLQEYTENIVAGIRRRGKNVGLIMCDLDYFKQVNDVHGHSAGDTVLKETSLLIRRSVRDTDFVIRFGGEEFLIVLTDIQENDSVKVAEKIREAVERARIRLPYGAIIAKTISLGVSEFPLDAESFWQAIKYADVALYKAKEAGRNRVVRFEESMWVEKQF